MHSFQKIVFSLIILLSFSFAQNLNLNTNISLFAQHFSYKDPGSERFLTEINISFSKSNLNTNNASVKDTIDIITEIYSEDALVVKGWHWFALDQYLQDDVKDVFLDQFTFAVDPGKYKLKIEVKNRSTLYRKAGNIVDQIEVKKWNKDVTCCSDIIISDLITKPKPDQEQFIKYGIFVQPYPKGIYSPKKPLLFYYWELYNLKNPHKKNLKVKGSIIDSDGKIVKELSPAKVHIAPKNNAFSLSGQNIMALRDGRYKLKLELFENDKKIAEKYSDNFRVMKSKPKRQVTLSNSKIDPVYMAMTEDEIDDEIHFLKYIMNEKTWKTLQVMDRQNKMINLTKFWKVNDYTKETEEIEFKVHYLKLVDNVREMYDDRNIDGVDTDMGRVILLYGEPSYINRNVDDEIARQSVEYWRYNNYQSFFLFVQENFVGPFILVHSSMRGEIRNPKWADYLQVNPDIVTD